MKLLDINENKYQYKILAMKNLILTILLALSTSIFAQSLIDQYEPHPNQTFNPYLYYTSNMYNGEFMLKFYNQTLNINNKNVAISYKIEVVSFPFIPSGFFTTGDAGTTTRDLVLPFQSTYGVINCGESGAHGFGWNGVLYKETNNIPFKNSSGEAFDITLASNSYLSQTGYNCNTASMYIPHAVLKIIINFHDGGNINEPILYSIPYIIDNTRGRLREYPFINTNSSGASIQSYDFLILPKIEFHETSNTFHTYNTVSNNSWTPNGTINYFPPLNIESIKSKIELYPKPQDYATSFFHIDNTSIYSYIYPAPYCVPNLEIRNARGTAYVGYDNNGVMLQGIQHSYTIDKPIDLTIINPEEKIIYNPSETNINLNGTLTFPSGYTFKTINGLYPTLSIVNATDPGNLYRDRRKVNVSNSSFPNTSNQHTSIYHVKSGSTLIIEPCVSIIDATIKVEQGGVVKYDANRVYLTNSSIIQSDPNTPGIIISNYNYNNQYFPDCKQDCYNTNNYNLYQNQYNSTIQITSNTTWTTTNISNYFNTTTGIVKVPGKITVKAGNTLTIEQGLSFQFSEVGKIIVEKGAKLIVNGVQNNEVVFTSACNNMWEGFEVWGDKDITQYANPHSATQQGYIELHYAEIRNAITGVLTGKRDNLTTITDDTKTGGLIKAFHTLFENNGTSVEFRPYIYKIGSIILPNYSNFVDCDFKTTAKLKDQNLFKDIAGTQVKLNGVRFFANNFTDCNFYTDKTLFEPHQRGKGIYAINSSLRLFDYYHPNSFTGFSEAVLVETPLDILDFLSLGFSDKTKVFIQKCSFTDNIHAIVLDQVSYCRIYRNTIDVPNSEKKGYANATTENRGYDNPVGIYLRWCSINDVQENTITGNLPGSTLPNSYGIIVNSTTGYSNSKKKKLAQKQKNAQVYDGYGRLYNNTITKLNYAIQGELNNGSNTGGNPNPSSFLPGNGAGQQFKCNPMSQNLNVDVFLIGFYDLYASPTPITYHGEFRDQGICGSANINDDPAGNTFSSGVNYNLAIDLVNNTSYNYFYKGGIYSPTNNFAVNNPPYVSTCATNAVCPSLLSIPCDDWPCILRNIQTMQSAIVGLMPTLAKIDGGNKNELLNIINRGSDIDIYNSLNDASPYLSDEVLLALIYKSNPIVEVYFEEIIIDNCGLSDTVSLALKEYELSSSAREHINKNINRLSPRSILYKEMDKAEFDLNIARMEMMFYAMDHPEQELNDDVLTQLQNDSSLGGLYRQYNWCMQSGMSDEVEAIFTTITQQEGEQQSNRYLIENIKRNIASQGNLSSSDYNTLIGIRDANPYYLPAQSIIKYYGGINFERVPFATSGSNARKARPEMENKNIIEHSKLKIVPNPASKQTRIIFDKTQSGLLIIYSTDGKIVKKVNVFTKESINIDVSRLNKGIYILKFTGEFTGSLKYAKLIVQ